MKCRLKSFSASRGVSPNPLAPRRTSGPIKASQMSPTIPILGRKRAAGLSGWFFEEILYVFLYHRGKFFDCKRDHIQENVRDEYGGREQVREFLIRLWASKLSAKRRAHHHDRMDDLTRGPKPCRRKS